MTFWSPIEVRSLFQAVAQAPSVHNTQAWVMVLRERSVQLYELWDITLPHHDPTGRDRLLSCGAALTNLNLAMRNLGWETNIRLFPDPARGDLVATVTAVRRQPPTAEERNWYDAIPDRRSHRLRFDEEPLSAQEIRQVGAALVGERMSSHQVAGSAEASAVAGLLEHAAELLRYDRRYQRELRSWTIRRGHPRAGIPEDRLSHALFGGLVRRGDGVPDHKVLTSRIDHECVFVIETADDSKRDHVLAGAAVQRAWLAATNLGLAASLITQPLQLPEIRSGLSDRLNLSGFPHALLRVGRSERVIAPVPRRPYAEVVRGR
jgi:nitroreductase